MLASVPACAQPSIVAALKRSGDADEAMLGLVSTLWIVPTYDDARRSGRASSGRRARSSWCASRRAIPGRWASGLAALEIVVDTRERYPFRFARQQASTSRAALVAGDYAVRRADGSIVAAVERKTIEDLASGLNNGTLVFDAKLELPRAALVVEERYSSLVKHAYAPAGFLPDMLARIQVRYPEVPIVFAETRPLAEEWSPSGSARPRRGGSRCRRRSPSGRSHDGDRRGRSGSSGRRCTRPSPRALEGRRRETGSVQASDASRERGSGRGRSA